jgi:shikimate dehydrogenase
VLLGHPVAHSLSPVFQNAALRAAGLTIVYSALDVAPAGLPAVLAGLRSEGAAGNVTIPHKRAVALACDRLTPLARRVGAVNTFWVEEGMLVGDNTDVAGFAAAVDELLGTEAGGRWPARIAVLGAGGAARSVLAAAERRGVAVVELHARTEARARELADAFPNAVVARGPIGPEAGLVVNATPVGMRDDALPAAPGEVPPGAAVLDLVYRRGETAWVRACRAAGHRAADGLGMLVAQGALAFERFTGLAPDVGVMRASLEAAG